MQMNGNEPELAPRSDGEKSDTFTLSWVLDNTDKAKELAQKGVIEGSITAKAGVATEEEIASYQEDLGIGFGTAIVASVLAGNPIPFLVAWATGLLGALRGVAGGIGIATVTPEWKIHLQERDGSEEDLIPAPLRWDFETWRQWQTGKLGDTWGTMTITAMGVPIGIRKSSDFLPGGLTPADPVLAEDYFAAVAQYRQDATPVLQLAAERGDVLAMAELERHFKGRFLEGTAEWRWPEEKYGEHYISQIPRWVPIGISSLRDHYMALWQAGYGPADLERIAELDPLVTVAPPGTPIEVLPLALQRQAINQAVAIAAAASSGSSAIFDAAKAPIREVEQRLGLCKHGALDCSPEREAFTGPSVRRTLLYLAQPNIEAKPYAYDPAIAARGSTRSSSAAGWIVAGVAGVVIVGIPVAIGGALLVRRLLKAR